MGFKEHSSKNVKALISHALLYLRLNSLEAAGNVSLASDSHTNFHDKSASHFSKIDPNFPKLIDLWTNINVESDTN